MGAWGLGWEVWLDGMEITQFTYFQQVGGLDVKPVSAEITYGVERLAMFIQGVDSIFDLTWVDRYYLRRCFPPERSGSIPSTTSRLRIPTIFTLFNLYEDEAQRLIKQGLVLPGYDYVLKCSHTLTFSMPGGPQRE